MANDNTSILGLARSVISLTEDLTQYLQANNIAAPTFALDSREPPDTPEYRRLHGSLKTSLEDLQRLIDGPSKWLRAFCCTGYDLGALQVALDFEFFRWVPADGNISLQNLAERSGLDVGRTGRVVRQLITYRIFEEALPGLISHSSTSLVMQRDEELRAVVHYSLDEMLKAAADCNITFKAHPYEAHQDINPFVTRHGVGIFEFYKNNPEKARRFSKAMAGLRRMDHHLDHLLTDSFDWSVVKGTVVDCGGGTMYPNLNLIVQDSNTEMLAQGRDSLSLELRDRIAYSQHSFFSPQPVRDAAVFLIRQCTHNWADKDVVSIFKGFIPGLENSGPDTPLLINDIILPEPGVWPRHQERVIRQVDMVMMVNCGAKQRTLAEFKSLLKEADPRYEVRKVFDNGPLGLLEVYLGQS
ncbi:hypothetical protein PG989_012116 [Apiospora arundinis]